MTKKAKNIFLLLIPFLLLASTVISLSIFYSAGSTPVPSTGSIDKYTPIQRCQFILFYDSTSSTYGAKDCILGNLVYGGPNNAGGASGTSAYAVISAALATNRAGLYEFLGATYNIAGTLSVANGESLVCDGPPTDCQFIETSANTVLMQIQSGSFSNQLTIELEGVNGADTLQVLADASHCSRYLSFNNLYVEMASGNTGDSSHWLVNIECAYSSFVDATLGNAGTTLNQNFFLWNNTQYPTVVNGNSEIDFLISRGSTTGIDYFFDSISHISINNLQGNGNGGSSMGIVFDDINDFHIGLADMESFGQVLNFTSANAIVFSQFFGGVSGSSVFPNAIVVGSTSTQISFLNGEIDGSPNGYTKPAFQIGMVTSSHLNDQNGLPVQISPTMRLKFSQIWNFTGGNLAQFAANFFSTSTLSYNTWYENTAATPIEISQIVTFGTSQGALIVQLGLVSGDANPMKLCEVQGTSQILTCTFVIPVGYYFEYTSTGTAGTLQAVAVAPVE